MIRINLLAVERKVRKTRSFSVSHQITAAGVLILLAAAAGIGWWYWSLQRRSAALDASIRDAQQQAERLRSVLTQVQDFEQRKAKLQQRVALIEELRRGQSGPVHLLDQISRSLPDRLWLTEMKQEGEEVRLEGRTTSLTSLSDLIGNLETSGYFKRPVEILDSQVESSDAGDLVRFSVKAQFAMPAR